MEFLEIEKKLKEFVEKHKSYIETDGKSSFSTCDHYNWDQDIWNHRNTLMNKFNEFGYNVTSKMNHGVLDIVIVKPINI